MRTHPETSWTRFASHLLLSLPFAAAVACGGAGGEDFVDTRDVPPEELAFCGDGVLDPAEECDDGDSLGGDGCSERCEIEPPAFVGAYLGEITIVATTDDLSTNTAPLVDRCDAEIEIDVDPAAEPPVFAEGTCPFVSFAGALIFSFAGDVDEDGVVTGDVALRFSTQREDTFVDFEGAIVDGVFEAEIPEQLVSGGRNVVVRYEGDFVAERE